MEMTDRIQQASILVEALPYIQRFSGKTIVVKYGGHAMTDDVLRRSFARDIVLLKYVGMHPIVVHGGGPQIGNAMERMGIEPHFVEGLARHRHGDDEYCRYGLGWEAESGSGRQP